MKTKVVILGQQCLTHAQKAEMWDVYRGFYHYSESGFMERITRNTHFSLYLHEDRIVGFTGLRIDKTQVNGRSQLLMYFGQTVISRAFRGRSLIQTTALLLVLKYWKAWLTSDVWFWYDALSYKAYLASAKCAREIYPSRRCPMTEKARQVRDFAGKHWYGDTYCRQSGTVAKEVNFLNDTSVSIFPDDLHNPDVAFFAQANPRYAEGHGLLTFVPVSNANIGVLIRRYWNRFWHGRKSGSTAGKAKAKPGTVFTT
ncbi:MAG: hypothetical protein KDC61_20750 [Saprospiraceae bacterium]|nr:hypothetical protein [Saprospiraceae bacterium]MCB0544811.1 hypothetical protein [Saprospiraceae bacterium]MCB0577000.1 hypothetical protein [Saprospiraceae bacterium]MCB9306141.1 hypothetical protein [Lewinellaceae bacterium]